MKGCYLAVLVLCVLSSSAQTVVVKDANTLKPIGQVTVSSGVTSISTDPSGQFDLNAFVETDTLFFQHLSYYPRFIPFERVAEDPEILLQSKAYSIAPVVISANKWQQNEKVVADHITVIEPKEIQLRNPGTSADLLESSGEVFVQKSQLGGGSPMIRGFAANRVLIVVDGVRMNNAIYRSGNLQNVINIDPNVVEVAEVIHGPGAMTYGSDAIGGVMDFHTYDPILRSDSGRLISGTAMARYASATEEITGHMRLNVAGEKFAWMGAYTNTSFGDPRMGSEGPDEYLREWSVESINGVDSVIVNEDPRTQLGNAFGMDHLLTKLRYQVTEDLKITFGARLSETTTMPRYDRLIQTRNGDPRSAVWEYGPQRWTMLHTKVEHSRDSGAWNNARLIVAYQDYDESRVDRGYRQEEIRTRSEGVKGLWVNLDLERQLSDRTQLFYGLESVSNKVSSRASIRNIRSDETEVINPRYPNGSDWSTQSVYGSVTSQFKKNWIFNGGLRLNRSSLNAVFDTSLFTYPETSTSLATTAITGSAGLIWVLDSARRLSIDLSRGFRAPNIDDIGKVFDSEPGTVIVPNPELSPEYVNGIEIGYEHVVPGVSRINVNSYYSLLDDAMIRRPFIRNGTDSIMFDGELSQVQALQNAAQAEVYGFHIGVSMDFLRYWSAEFHYNWQDGIEKDEEQEKLPARHVPPAFTSISVQWEKGKGILMLLGRFSDGFSNEDLAPSEQNKPHIYAVNGDGLPFSPSWYTIDLKGSYALSNMISISGGIENITDQRYRTYSSGMVAPGRNFLATLRASF